MNFKNAINKAETIAKNYNSERLAPFPFKEIEKKHPDLKIYLSDMEDEISGAILYDKKKDEFKVTINQNKSKTRQYFTIAHELGHYFLHGEKIRKDGYLVDNDQSLSDEIILYRLDSRVDTQVEFEANQFAATLIMPEEVVRKAWKIIQNVEECARLFQVSVSAMSIRLENLNLITH